MTTKSEEACLEQSQERSAALPTYTERGPAAFDAPPWLPPGNPQNLHQPPGQGHYYGQPLGPPPGPPPDQPPAYNQMSPYLNQPPGSSQYYSQPPLQAYDPIQLFPRYTFPTRRKLVIKHSNHLKTDFDVFVQKGNADHSSSEESRLEKILSGTSSIISFRRKRIWHDAETNTPIFRVYEKIGRKLWDIEATDANGEKVNKLGSINPSYSTYCWFDRFEMYLEVAPGLQQFSKIDVKGDSLNKVHMTVYCGGKLMMDIKRTDNWAYLLCGKRLTWEVDLAAGVDASLAAIIVALSSDIMCTALRSS